MGRHATNVNHLAFSVAKVLQKETGALGQVPTVGCQPGGLRMHVWFKWINWVKSNQNHIFYLLNKIT